MFESFYLDAALNINHHTSAARLMRGGHADAVSARVFGQEPRRPTLDEMISHSYLSIQITSLGEGGIEFWVEILKNQSLRLLSRHF